MLALFHPMNRLCESEPANQCTFEGCTILQSYHILGSAGLSGRVNSLQFTFRRAPTSQIQRISESSDSPSDSVMTQTSETNISKTKLNEFGAVGAKSDRNVVTQTLPFESSATSRYRRYCTLCQTLGSIRRSILHPPLTIGT
jgi:hypothetical protein